MNYETEAGALLLFASGVFFYLTMDETVVGALLVAGGAWAMILPRFLQAEDSASG